MPRITENTIWTTDSGERIRLKDLSDNHLDNIIHFLHMRSLYFNRILKPTLTDFLIHMQLQRAPNYKKKKNKCVNIKEKINSLCTRLYSTERYNENRNIRRVF